MKKFILSAFVLFAMCSCAHADELSELKSMFQTMQVQMGEMQGRIEQLEQEKQIQSSKDKQEIERLQMRVEGLEKADINQPVSALSTLNPQVSVIGDFIYKSDKNGGEGDNQFNMREVEVAFSANVDTYARGDVIVAIENEDGSTEVALEEGYLTLLETPIENLQGKFGKFRPYMGKTNKMHLHQLPWSDYPLVVQNFLGEEGNSEAGASLSYLILNPADIYSEITLEAFNNGSTVFGGGEDGETVYLAHLKNFFDITDETSFEIGNTFSFGENGDGNGAESRITGVDLTINSTELFVNKRTTSHTEALFNVREQAAGDDINSWGMFTSLEQQLTDRWWAFGRYDFSQTPSSSEVDTHAYSTGLTFAQSEYVFWRAMFTHTDNETSDDNTVWLQLDFSIGPHKPHAYR